ncbi:hypothetical protein [Mesorhizobium sp. LjNodule214]|uniref:hypothetical protein n=1 Tax=Mesorhizobium sp. LjNodule214 TaxID=3342252 RepID=UPI003ECC1EB5
MEFRLIFEGDLKPRQRAKLADIHKIRMTLHQQMKALWSVQPLSLLPTWKLTPNAPGAVTALQMVGAHKFIALVHERLSVRANLDIILLRSEPPEGSLINHGDIDNRLKTLFDALRVPSAAELKSLGVGAVADEFTYCLLQDDKLVTKVSVEVDRLLTPDDGSNKTLAIVKVNLRATLVTMSNLGIVA